MTELSRADGTGNAGSEALTRGRILPLRNQIDRAALLSPFDNGENPNGQHGAPGPFTQWALGLSGWPRVSSIACKSMGTVVAFPTTILGTRVEELIKYMKALTYLQLQTSLGREVVGRPEVLLARAGFSHREIGELLGKTTAAVAKTISRSKNAPAQDGDTDE
ncbi:MAG: phasin family protein [Planctomycetota bacterium]